MVSKLGSKSLARIAFAAFLLACERRVLITVDVKKADATPVSAASVAPSAIPSGAECAVATDCVRQGSCFGIPQCTSRKTVAVPICDPKNPAPKMPSFWCGCDAGKCVVE
jgi:hypothetical protein